MDVHVCSCYSRLSTSTAAFVFLALLYCWLQAAAGLESSCRHADVDVREMNGDEPHVCSFCALECLTTTVLVDSLKARCIALLEADTRSGLHAGTRAAPWSGTSTRDINGERFDLLYQISEFGARLKYSHGCGRRGLSSAAEAGTRTRAFLFKTDRAALDPRSFL